MREHNTIISLFYPSEYHGKRKTNESHYCSPNFPILKFLLLKIPLRGEGGKLGGIKVGKEGNYT